MIVLQENDGGWTADIQRGNAISACGQRGLTELQRSQRRCELAVAEPAARDTGKVVLG